MDKNEESIERWLQQMSDDEVMPDEDCSDVEPDSVEYAVESFRALKLKRIKVGHTKSKVWQDFSIESAHAHLEGLSTGLKAPSGKGNEDGFVDGQLIFESKKGDGDYHHEMNSAIFE
ncbi:hypothetical protein EVAR_12577_1 [Eumeta japonica]|uniref:Uncharacterized protein n=1 Tax=Eumeta variegata TaxID=151549 RepID=A0A4C1UEK1_EUMVA|nr:hypothetical protein EVAR_12577_1 [Eumeta japonica]